MPLHHSAFGIWMHFQHTLRHHSPSLTVTAGKQSAFFIIHLQNRGVGPLYKMHNPTKKDVYQLYKHLRKWIWNCSSSCHYKKKKEIWNFSYYFPSNRIFDEVVVLFFSQSKAINDAQHAWAPVALVRLLCFAASALFMTTRAQRKKWCFMKTPPSNSSFHTLPIFFPLPFLCFPQTRG